MASAEHPASDAATPGSGGGPGSVTRPRSWAARVAVLVVLVAAVLLVRATLVTPVRVSSASMEPTLAAGDVVLVGQRSPGLADLDRGDLVTFLSPEDRGRTIKRVIGLPGDSLVIKDSVLHLNGRPVEEPYVDHELIDGYYSRTFSVPEGTVFLLGDNRGNSVDSRDYGPVPADDLLGRVVVRLWPVVRPHGQEPRPPDLTTAPAGRSPGRGA